MAEVHQADQANGECSPQSQSAGSEPTATQQQNQARGQPEERRRRPGSDRQTQGKTGPPGSFRPEDSVHRQEKVQTESKPKGSGAVHPQGLAGDAPQTRSQGEQDGGWPGGRGNEAAAKEKE